MNKLSEKLECKPIRIAFVGQPEYFRIHYKDMLRYQNWCSCEEIPIRLGCPEDYTKLLYEDFDYIFFFRGEFCPEGILKNLSGVKVVISSEPFPKISTSGLLTSKELRDRFNIFKKVKDMGFDYIFHYDRMSIPWMEIEGINISGEFQLPISKVDCSELDLGDKTWDVCFFGRSNEYRESMLGALKRDFKTIHVCHGADEELLLEIMLRSKIVLNLNTEDLPSLNPRLSQALSVGSFVISEPLSHNDTFIAGEDYIECRYNTIYDTVKEWLSADNFGLISDISSNGANKAEEKLECVKCWKELITEIKNENTICNDEK